MNLEQLQKDIVDFSKENHGQTDFDRDIIFIKGAESQTYAPLSFFSKKYKKIFTIEDFQKLGFIADSIEIIEDQYFQKWYEKQFNLKLTADHRKKVLLLSYASELVISQAINQIDSLYQKLREEKILLNSKNLPIQLGEWYAKKIFGLKQLKSTSQRGFDFFLNTQRVEVKIFWGDISSPKGVKIKRSLVSLSDYTIILYLGLNLMIREICFLDGPFILRKFSSKSLTIFLKDIDLHQYFISKTDRFKDKVINKKFLLKFAAPHLALKLAERFGGEDSTS